MVSSLRVSLPPLLITLILEFLVLDFFYFIQYSEMIEQVDRDVKRTHPDMDFFCGDSSFAKSNQVSLRHVGLNSVLLEYMADHL